MKNWAWLDALAVWNLGSFEVAALEHLMGQATDAEKHDELLYLVRTRSLSR